MASLNPSEPKRKKAPLGTSSRVRDVQVAVLSDKCEPVSEWPVTVALCRTELTPLSESGSAVKLEFFSAVEVAFLVEMIVDRRVDGDEFLQGSHAPKADHCPFSSSEWLM